MAITGELIYAGPPGKRPFLVPDQVADYLHHAPEGASLTVYDRFGLPFCGRVVDGAKEHINVTAINWEWRPVKKAVRYAKRMCFHSVCGLI